MATPFLKIFHCTKRCTIVLLSIVQLIVEWLKGKMRGNP
jgi:hypothetical protein